MSKKIYQSETSKHRTRLAPYLAAGLADPCKSNALFPKCLI